ncbi:hypothetical protein G7Y89_g15510 [Cudoniella acicularis]|uniref:Uncharacterized protein n=1 Tax=Cudoniella acicularis TaxID=354080 RepID=A0A8H4VKM2_9HELO|nr:hypothetical protein G7Y89_g15510 [Cudoniella acicularis]
MSSNTTIYVGFWTNYSKGAVLGSTLTLSNRNGAILIGALAVFIQLIGGRSWSIICFIAHQLRATTQAKDGMHHQQQATLRNSGSDIGTFWQFTLIGWAWRKRSMKTFQRSIVPIVIGVLHLIAFGAAGILSSKMTSAGKEVLIAESPFCGTWEKNVDNNDSVESSIAWKSYYSMTLDTSWDYVQNCLVQSQSLPECDRFKRQQFSWNSTRVNCPWGDLCLGSANSSFKMDTGLLDSRDDLGINSQDKDRIRLRKTSVCSPITTENYTKNGTSVINYSNPSYEGSNAMNYTALFYGRNYFNFTHEGIPEPTLQNATYIYTNFRDIEGAVSNNDKAAYDIHSEVADIGIRAGTFSPVPVFRTPNSTLTLVFASYYGLFTQPSEDLWLAAHRPHGEHMSQNSIILDTIGYATDNDVSVLGCVDQFQVCNPSRNSTAACTPLLSLIQMDGDRAGELKKILDTDRQMLLANTTFAFLRFSDIQTATTSLGSPLLVTTLSDGGASLAPSPDQWIIETSNLFTTGSIYAGGDAESGSQQLSIEMVMRQPNHPTHRLFQFPHPLHRPNLRPRNPWNPNKHVARNGRRVGTPSISKRTLETTSLVG